MARHHEHTVVFAPEVVDHLDAIERKFHGALQRTIDEQLSYTPARETRNRKPLEQPSPFDATWELRCGPGNRFRVFYDVNSEEHAVMILAVGVKDRNRLFIGGKEYQPS